MKQQKNQQVLNQDDQYHEQKFKQEIQNKIQLYDKQKNNAVEVDKCDICFLIDATLSVCPLMQSFKEKIKEIFSNLKTIQQQTEQSIVRTAVVAYRDYTVPEQQRFEFSYLNENLQETEDFIENLKAYGGGDTAEDVNGGLQQALLRIGWQRNINMLIHIADAPAHNQKYHDLKGKKHDKYPQGAPQDIDFEYLFEQMNYFGINYIFLKTSQITDTMISEFKKIQTNLIQKDKFKQTQIKQFDLSNFDLITQQQEIKQAFEQGVIQTEKVYKIKKNKIFDEAKSPSFGGKNSQQLNQQYKLQADEQLFQPQQQIAPQNYQYPSFSQINQNYNNNQSSKVNQSQQNQNFQFIQHNRVNSSQTSSQNKKSQNNSSGIEKGQDSQFLNELSKDLNLKQAVSVQQQILQSQIPQQQNIYQKQSNLKKSNQSDYETRKPSEYQNKK